MKATTMCLLACACLFGNQSVRGQAPTVFHVRMAGPLGVTHLQLVERALSVADQSPGAHVVFEFDSDGGRLDLAQLMANGVQESPHRVFALINRAALSAASLVALATDSVYMTTGATLGGGYTDATILRDLPPPAMSALRAAFAALVAKRGVPVEVGAAMVDESVRIEGIVDAGKLLTLTADGAVDLGLAEARVDDFDGMMQAIGLQDFEIVPIGSEWLGTTVDVQNFNVMDARVFVVRGASRFRLGTVTSMGSSSFDVPGQFLPDGAYIRIGIELIGSSERLETERIRVQPGLVILWALENALSQSSFSYYIR